MTQDGELEVAPAPNATSATNGRLAVELTGSAPGAPAIVDILDADLNMVENREVRLGSVLEVPIAPGQYLVEARLPSGERTRRRVEVASGGNESRVSLAFARSSHEWMGVAQYADSSVARRARAKRRGDSFVPARCDCSVSVLRREGGRWLAFDGVLTAGPADDEARMYAIADPGPTDALRVVLISAADGSSRFAMRLPTAWPLSAPSRLELIVHTPSHQEQGSNPRVTLTRPGDPLFDGLVAFACAGDTDGVRQTTAASFGEARLLDKLNDPVGAVLGAYVLLRMREVDRLTTWTQSLTARFPWLPDGFLALAWQRVLEGRTGDVPALLAQAMDAGPPIFSEGMRILGDSLTLLRGKSSGGSELEARVFTARSAWMHNRPFASFDLKRVERYSTEANPTIDTWQLGELLRN